MIKRKKQLVYWLMYALFIMVSFCLLTTMGGITNTSAEYEVETSETIRESYMLGEKFIIPDGELVQGENRYSAEQSMLVFPDETIKTGREQVLTLEGDYSLLYVAKAGSNNIVAKKNFSVVNSYYSFSGDTSGNATFEYTENFNMAPESGLSGIKVQMPKGTIFHVNEVFDISMLTENNPVVTIYPYNNTFLMGKNGKTVQANDIQIILTDYYDSSNYIVLDFHWVKAEYTSPLEYSSKLNYWAGVSDSALCGMVPSSTGKIVYNDKKYSKQTTYYGVFADYMRSDIWRDADGKLVELDANLPSNAVYSSSAGFSFYYDYESMDVYASDTKTKKFVSNLGLSDLYSDKAFRGFTGDKFYLSICADDYRATTGSTVRDLVADLEISTILGKSGKDLFIENASRDVIPPYIEIESTGRELVIAKGEKIKIPLPVVKDVNLKSVVSEVYFGYGTSQQSFVAIENGTFTPNRLGKYTIVYVAEDMFGNIGSACLDIDCKLLPENRSLRLEVERVNSPQAGTLLSLPRCKLVGDNAGNTIKIFYAYGDEEFIELDESAMFFIDHVGTYKIRYEYSNLLVSYTDEYEFISVPSNCITFNMATLPKYFVKGSTYTLENLFALKYSEANPLKCEVVSYVSEDGATFKEINANEYLVEASSNVQFKYVLDEEEAYSDFIPVKDVKNGNGEIVMANHFVTTDFECEEKIDRLVFSPKNFDNNTMEFVYPISVSNFFLELRVPKEYANYESIVVTLTDYYNNEKVIRIVYKRFQVSNATGTFYAYTLSCNGKTYRNYEKNYEDNLMQIYCTSGKLYDNGGAIFDIENILGSDKALMTISVTESMVGESKLEISKLNNVVLCDFRYDNTRPQLYYKKDCALYESLNTEITVYPAEVTDVLSSFVVGNLEMYVTGPNNSTVTALDGTILNNGIDATKSYTFRLDQNGIYTVYYKYTDTNGNVRSQNYKIYILDSVAPILTLDGGYNENTLITVEENELYTVQTYKAADSVTYVDDLVVSIIAEAPDGSMTPVNGGKLLLVNKGIWKIYYYCMDEAGNAAMTYYTVKVK